MGLWMIEPFGSCWLIFDPLFLVLEFNLLLEAIMGSNSTTALVVVGGGGGE